MELDRALEIVAAAEEDIADAAGYFDRMPCQNRFDELAAAVLTLVLHGRETGAFEYLAGVRPEHRPVWRALSGEAVDD